MNEFRVDGLWGRYYLGEKGTFILIHGLASSSGEFFDYPERINSRGYGVIIFDFSGHGKSEGIEGYESVEKNLKEIRKVVEKFEGEIKKPLILLGHSLGAATVIYGASDGIGDLCVAISPPASIKSEMKVGERILLPLIYGIGRIYEKLSGKRFYIKYRAVYDTIFVKKETVEKAKEMGFLSNKLWIDSYKPLITVNTLERAKNVDIPCLVVVPSGDKLVNPENQKRVYQEIFGEKEIYIAQGYNHSVMGEDRGEIIEKIIEFVERHRTIERIKN